MGLDIALPSGLQGDVLAQACRGRLGLGAPQGLLRVAHLRRGNAPAEPHGDPHEPRAQTDHRGRSDGGDSDMGGLDAGGG
jgi:hypothetical protein